VLFEVRPILKLLCDQVGWATLVPFPLVRLRILRDVAAGRIQRSEQAAAVEQRDEMSAFSDVRINILAHQQRCCFGFDFRDQLLQSNRMQAIQRLFLITNDATGDMPPGSIELIMALGEQSASVAVLNEQVRIYQGREPADEQQ
jgi:hypothetical protein